MNPKALFCLFVGCIFLAGCAGSQPQFQLKDLAKSDINQVSEVHFRQATVLIERLTGKLYRMNPGELKKTPGATIASRTELLVQCPPAEPPDILEGKTGTDAILLGFDETFKGDRVFAVAFGLYTMIHASYNQKCDLYMLDFLDEQNLYNAARNIEILVWRLKTRYKTDGSLYFHTNTCEGPVQNLSFERLFGKLISLQDTMALIVSERSGRMIKEVVHMAGMSFLPIGI